MSQQQIDEGPSKRIKVNNQGQQNDKQWIVIRKKTTPLTITIADHSKIHRYYSHKSIQKYIRYLTTQTCPNPMWLAIKRQSQIQHIYYIDIQIQDYLFEKMVQEKTLPFLGENINIENKAFFRQTRLNRYIWDSLFIYDQQARVPGEQLYQEFINTQQKRKMGPEIYKKYLSNILTPHQLKQNLYPDMRLALYKSYHSVISRQILINGAAIQKIQLVLKSEQILMKSEHNEQKSESILKAQLENGQISQTSNQSVPLNYEDKNLILVIDCQMVSTAMGFELARCTIVNYEEDVIFDEFFKPKNAILNYNTEFSGITKEILDPITNTIQTKLYPFLNSIITKDTILIGHSLENDFNAMEFYHPKVVDTSVLFRRKNGSKMKLKSLADKILNRKIQSLTHDSKQDCLATLHLVKARIQNDKVLQTQKQYHLLRDMVKAKHNILIVDYDIQNMRCYNSIHFQKVQPLQNADKIVEIIKKYSNKNQVAVPKAIFTRFNKPQLNDWEGYYNQIDQSLEKLYNCVPAGSVFFLNFQVNEVIRIVPFTKQQSQKTRSRPFFVVLPKN